MSIRRPDPARSRIVLIGTPGYADAALPDVPVVADNITDLARVLTDPAAGGFDRAHCLIAAPTAGPEKIGDLLTQAANEAEDLLLFYYAGHGLLSPRRRELYLSLHGTRPDLLAFTALAFEAVRDVCLDSRAARRVVILDSCFSGRAIGETLSDDAVLGQVEVNGTYTLTAAPANRVALVLDGERHTAFTERLLQLLHTGIPEAGPLLSLGDIYRHLRARLRADGLPEPQQRGTATADLLALVPNHGYRPPAPPAAQHAPPAALPEQLRAALDSGYPSIRAAAVQELASWLTDPDPGRVLTAQTTLQRIADTDLPAVADLAHTALTSHQPPEQTQTQTRPAPAADTALPTPRQASHVDDYRQRAIAALNTAERVANSISDGGRKAQALAGIAVAVAATGPGRAERLLGEAEHQANSITREWAKAQALAGIAVTVATTNPDRAERLAGEAEHRANSVTDKWSKAQALADIAVAVAATDPDRAERLANSITAEWSKAQALAGVAVAVAATNPDRAERLANSITAEWSKAQALAGVAVAVATTNPDRAERLASSITNKIVMVQALADIAVVVAATDPDRAERLLGKAEHRASSIAKHMMVQSEAAIAMAVATIDPDRAEQLANSISDGGRKAQALAGIAVAVAATDPDRAERLANSITAEWSKAQALAGIAKVWLASVTHPLRSESMA